jgi:sigma-70-like protein
LARSDGDMSLRPWLHTIVRNGALNSLRDEPVHVHLDENYDGVPQPPDVAARREELAALTAGIRALPDEQRQALVKRELEGRSHQEIGASLGLSPGAVRGLIYRARTALRDGAGMLIPLPVLRALLSSGSAAPDATGTAGAAAAGLAGGGGGIALKAGATLGVAAIAVGSGIAVQHRGDGSTKEPTGATFAPAHSAGAHNANGSGAVRLADVALPGDRRGANEGAGPASSGPGGGRNGSSGSSGPGSGGRSGGGGSSGPGSGSGGSGDGGRSGSGSGTSSGSGSDDGGGGGSTSSGSGDGGGGSTTSGDGGSSGSGSGSGDGISGSSGDGGGTSTSDSGGGDSSGSGSGDVTTTTGGSGGDGGGSTTTTTDGGGDGSGGSDGSSGGGSD